MRLSNKRGFALAEALIASFIMVIGLLTVLAVIYSQHASLGQNREKAIATLAAQEKIEAIRGMAFNDILDPSKLTRSFTAIGPDIANRVPGLIYLRNSLGTVVIDNDLTNDPAIPPNTQRVSVTVTWVSISGATLQRTLTTLITRGGINKQ